MPKEMDKSVEEARIRHLLEDWEKAVSSRDLDKLMLFYSPDIISFDVIPPLQYIGIEANRKTWQMGLNAIQGPTKFQTEDLHLTISQDVAYCHKLVHMSGTMNDGQAFDNWMRWTLCFRKIDGHWLITHEHVSVPIDMETGKGLMDLKP